MFNFQDGMDYNKPPKSSKGNKKIILLVIFSLLVVFVVSAAIAWYSTRNSDKDTAAGNDKQQLDSKRSSTADRFVDSLASTELRSIIDNSSLAGNEEDAKQLADFYNEVLDLKNCRPKENPRVSTRNVKQESYSCPAIADSGSSDENLLITYEDGVVIFIEIAPVGRDAYSPEFIEKLGNL